MSYDVLKNGWFGWNMPASISLGDGFGFRPCRIKDITDNRAKLEVHRADEIPDQFLLHLTASGSLPLDCKVITRAPTMVEIEFVWHKPEYGLVQTADYSDIDTKAPKPAHVAKSSDIASQHRSRRDLEMLRGTAIRRRTRRGVIFNSLIVTAVCASLLFVSVVLFDCESKQSSTYQLAGSTTASAKRVPSDLGNSPAVR